MVEESLEFKYLYLLTLELTVKISRTPGVLTSELANNILLSVLQ